MGASLKDLTSLRDQLQEFFGESVHNLGTVLHNMVTGNNHEKLGELLDVLGGELETDSLQPLYQYYLADREDKGQDFTPPSIGRLLAKLTNPHGTVYDLCAGSGSLTIQAWRSSPKTEFVCEEMDENVIPFLLANLALRNIRGWVIHRNALTLEMFATYRLERGERFSTVHYESVAPEFQADVVISNPPYNLRWDAPDPLLADGRFQIHGIPPASSANFAFILTGLSRLKQNGKAAFVLPNGILTSEPERPVRQSLVYANQVRAVLALPERMFEATSIPVCVMLFGKDDSEQVSIVDCREVFTEEIREQRGQWGGASHENRVYTKTINTFTDEQMQTIADALKVPMSGLSVLQCVPDIAAQDYNLSPARYVQKPAEAVRHRPFEDILDDINRIGREKNVVKLTINEVWAKETGLDEVAATHDQSIELTNGLKRSFSLFSREPVVPDYIKLSKSKELKFENRDKELLSSIFTMALSMWRQHIYYLNCEENRLLAEFRDALLPELMSGRLSLDAEQEATA